MKLDWQTKETVEARISDKTLLPFLFHSDSLTRFIQQQCQGIIEVELKAEGWGLAEQDEAEALKITPQSESFIRESWLKSDQHYLVYARSIIPQETFTQISEQLTQLGTRPLGELLFADESSYRSEMRYASVPSNCSLLQAAQQNVEISDALWARQSLFYIRNKPLLIIEIFLPAIKSCLQT